jgi:hypothetical protein
MADVMPEQQVVDRDGLEGDVPAGTGDLDAVDKQLIDRLVGRAGRVGCSWPVRVGCSPS